MLLVTQVSDIGPSWSSCLIHAHYFLSLIPTDDLYATVGCHPTRCSEFEKSRNPEKYMADLLQLALNNRDKVVACGEFGLGIVIN